MEKQKDVSLLNEKIMNVINNNVFRDFAECCFVQMNHDMMYNDISSYKLIIGFSFGPLRISGPALSLA